MGTTIRITGDIGRPAPDPSAPSDPTRQHIGMVSASWTDGDYHERGAALIKVATGRGTGDRLWGPSVLVMRWIGDPPPAQIAQTVYDVITDGGPGQRAIRHMVESLQRSESQPSYRAARPS